MLVFLILPYITFNDHIKSNSFKPIHRKLYWFLICNLIFLGF